MCGIVGYVGDKACENILVTGLKNLEYRGYDSAGIAVFEGDKIKTVKAKGEIKEGLIPALEAEGSLKGTVGIGHTRWATHGEPSDVNAHPIGNARITIVHNGIIENYRKIKEFLIKKGYSFESQTDTESVAKLLDYNYNGDPVATIAMTVAQLEGAYSLGIIFREHKDKIYAVRKESPLVVGKGSGEMFIASDITAILEYTNQYYLPEAGEIAEIDKHGVTFYDIHHNTVTKELQTAEWDVTAAQKGGYEHFMLKEIHEQPAALKNTITPRIN
ncbi:MAG: class II glutamine amidotransferase, partial [Ruminiclostridium sp.]|nr:class II glutamine amidotransferase [Ruminiclostridium sp.]